MSETARTTESTEEPSTLTLALGGGAFLAAATAVWVLLTIATDRTYHLAPVVIAIAPGVIARVAERRIGWTVAVLPGLLAVGVGWGVILAADAEPTTTLAESQPGGVAGEVVAGAIIGAAASAFLGTSRRGSVAGPSD